MRWIGVISGIIPRDYRCESGWHSGEIRYISIGRDLVCMKVAWSVILDGFLKLVGFYSKAVRTILYAVEYSSDPSPSKPGEKACIR